MTAQGVNKNVLDGLILGGMIAVHSASALRDPEMDPVRRSIAGATITGAIHQSLQQERPITVDLSPILRQSMGSKRKDFACESLDVDPGQHEEATIGNDQLKVAFPLFRIPSDPGIAGRHRPCGAGKLQAGEIAPGQLAGFDEIAQVGAEGDAVAKVMVTVDILLEQGIERRIRSLDKVENQGIKIAGATCHRSLGVALRGADNMSRTGRCRGTKTGQDNDALIAEVFEKRAAFFVLEFPGRAFPFEKFADGFGQLGEAEVAEITNCLTDECELGRGKVTAGKGNLRFRHGCSPLLLVSLRYPERDRMSSEKCSQAKIFVQELGDEAVLEHSDCRYQSKKLRRQPGNQVGSGRADQTARITDKRCANIRKTDK